MVRPPVRPMRPWRVNPDFRPAAEGALYGLAVWGGSYLGLMPATGLYRSADEEPAARNALMITAHIVWGAPSGVIFHSLTRKGSDRIRPAGGKTRLRPTM